jgi:hypothetical protein
MDVMYIYSQIQILTYLMSNHIFTKAIGAGVRSGTIIVDISDHLPTFLQIEGTRHKASSEPVSQRNFNETNMSNFRDC